MLKSKITDTFNVKAI